MRWLHRFSALLRRERRVGPESQIRRRVRGKSEVVIREVAPLPDSERLSALRALEARYFEQRSVLEERFEQQDVTVFIADYAVAAPLLAQPFSYCVWTRGVLTLLPESEFVVLSAVAAEASDYWEALVPWTELLRLTGSVCLVQEPDLVPARYRAVAWPDEPMLRQLRAAAVRL
jgi:hypothetical protein